MRTNIKCKFLGLTHVMGEQIKDMGNVAYGLRAKVIRLSDHPRLGAPDLEDRMFTITSRIQSIDWNTRIIVTENNTYEFI